ncbi:protein ORD [Drosophila eugracilis]|uniref:protein ORD n=1 Tax=Drosophila eugracilis TaxID=29029 RepID=UPI001BDABA73|nr:protein ORD [Drosophila eugracilis]
MSETAALNKNHSIRLISLYINDCLDCERVHLKFSTKDNVHLIIYDLDKDLSKDLPAVTPVAQAILLLCTLSYPNEPSLSKLPQLKIGKGSLSLIFEMHPIDKHDSMQQIEEVESDLDETPSTSQQALLRERQRKARKDMEASLRRLQSKVITVNVERRFDDLTSLDTVSYQINGGQSKTLTITEFHEMFFVRHQHSINYLEHLHQKCSGNWLKLIQSSGDGDPFKDLKDPDSPFEIFVKLFDHQAMQPQDVITKLVKKCLHVNEAVRLAERKFVLDVFNQVRRIFEFITMNEYTVWFLVPCLHNKDQLRPMTIDDFDLTKVRTSIRAAGDTRNIYWDFTDHNIKDLLMVAFQLALATNVNQSVLVISHLEKLSEFLTMQYVTASFMNDSIIEKDSDPKWICHRYLQRIIEMALFMGTIVIIEYPSSLTLLKEPRQLIKCFQMEKRGSLQWKICSEVIQDTDEHLEFLKEAITNNRTI